MQSFFKRILRKYLNYGSVGLGKLLDSYRPFPKHKIGKILYAFEDDLYTYQFKRIDIYDVYEIFVNDFLICEVELKNGEWNLYYNGEKVTIELLEKPYNKFSNDSTRELYLAKACNYIRSNILNY